MGFGFFRRKRKTSVLDHYESAAYQKEKIKQATIRGRKRARAEAKEEKGGFDFFGAMQGFGGPMDGGKKKKKSRQKDIFDNDIEWF